jgi:hypothetical protein
MIQPDNESESLSSMHLDEQKRLSRRSAFKKAMMGGVALYVAPQILCSELVRAQGVVSGVGGGGGGGGGTDVLPFVGIPALGALAAGGGGAGAAGALPALLAEAPGGGSIAPGTTIAEGAVPGAAGTPGSPLGPAGPRATLPPEPLRRGGKNKRRQPKATEGPKRAIRGLW